MAIGNFHLLKNYANYRFFWLANFFSGLALWIQNVAAGTYAANLTDSPFLISLIQVSLTLPVFIFSIPAGIMADRSRTYFPLLSTQLGMSIIALLYIVVIFFDLSNIYIVVLLTFIMGSVYAFGLPIRQSNITKTIPAFEIKQGAILNNLGFNISRCIGPFLAGILYASFSPSMPFIVACLLFFYGTYLFYTLSKKDAPIESAPFVEVKFKEALQLLKKNSLFIYMCFGTAAFFLFTAGFWAMLPYIAKYQLNMPDTGLGYLTAASGAGAILSGLVSPFFRNTIKSHTLLFIMFIVAGISQWMSLFHIHIIVTLFSVACFGFSWAAAVSLLNGEMQTCTPSEYRGKTIALYFLVMYFSLAVGGLLIGWIAACFGANFALWFSGIGLILSGGIFFIIPNFYPRLKCQIYI